MRRNAISADNAFNANSAFYAINAVTKRMNGLLDGWIMEDKEIDFGMLRKLREDSKWYKLTSEEREPWLSEENLLCRSRLNTSRTRGALTGLTALLGFCTRGLTPGFNMLAFQAFGWTELLRLFTPNETNKPRRHREHYRGWRKANGKTANGQG